MHLKSPLGIVCLECKAPTDHWCTQPGTTTLTPALHPRRFQDWNHIAGLAQSLKES
jgi:hypothetical protein